MIISRASAYQINDIYPNANYPIPLTSTTRPLSGRWIAGLIAFVCSAPCSSRFPVTTWLDSYSIRRPPLPVRIIRPPPPIPSARPRWPWLIRSHSDSTTPRRSTHSFRINRLVSIWVWRIKKLIWFFLEFCFMFFFVNTFMCYLGIIKRRGWFFDVFVSFCISLFYIIDIR